MSIKVDNLSFAYGNREVLHHINVDIPDGMLVNVLGPNGVGRSTLFRCILGLNHGYSGTIKKWNMHIGPKGHGSGYHRGIGSVANNGRDNNRVIPGKKMSGHWGPEQVTVQNVTIIESNAEKGYILVKGGVPGPKKAIVMLRSPIKVQFRKPEVKPLLVVNQEAPKAEAAEEKKGE